MNAKKRFVSLKTKIITATLVPVVLSFVLIVLVTFFSLSGTLRHAAEARFLHVGQKYASSFETNINSAMNYLSILASELEVRAATGSTDREALQKTVLKIFEDYELLDGSSVYFETDCYDGMDAAYRNTAYGTAASGRICWYFYKDGGKTAYLPEGLENDIEFELPHYTMAKEGNRPIYTDPVVYEIDGKNIAMFTLTHPIRDGAGRFIGAVTVDLFLDDIYAQLQNEVLYETGYVLISNDNGRMIYSPRYDDIGKTLDEIGLDSLPLSGTGGTPFFTGTSLLNGQDTLMTVSSIYIARLDSRFYISVAAPLREINADGTRLLLLLGLFGALVAASIAGLLYYLIGKISAPLNAITESVDKIAGGDYDTRITGDFKGEFAVMKDSVNTMADSIETYMSALDRRLGQQDLMASISQSFLSDADIDTLVGDALRRVGEFIGAAQILFYREAETEATFLCENEWINPALGLQTRIGGKMVLHAAIYSRLLNLVGEQSYITSGDPALKALMASYRQNFPSFITIPIYLKGMLYGVLDFAREEAAGEWSESDLNLATLVSSLLSGVFDRDSMEGQLRRLSSIVESSPQFILTVTADGRIDYVNPAAETITGYTETELMAGGLDLILDAPTARRIREYHIPITLQNGADTYEISLLRRDGQKRMMAFCSFITGTGAANVGCIASDVTEIRALEAELIASKELAEQGSRSKSEFLSRMSHEMRTPMNAIIGMTGIARESGDPAKKEYCLDRIDNASRHLLGVINDILDMSKIEANKFELSQAEFSFDRMLLNVLNVVNFRVEEKEQHLSLFVDPSMPPTLIGDEQRLAQVLTNLLTNAAKFTPEYGTIQLKANVLGEENGTFTIRIEVTDSGIGISEEQQVRLFHSFEQADGSIARKFGGTGLGLAISKRIVELMGGEIWVESELGEGASFLFTFQAQKGQSTGRDALRRFTSIADLTVMVVDDSEEVRDYFKHVMDSMGIHCVAASGGTEALELFHSAARPFDILFVDWKMPFMNGIELTRELRTLTGAHPIIIMISASEWGEVEAEAIGAGIDGFVPKPLFPSLLMDCINQHLRVVSPGEPAPAPEAAGPRTFAGKTALLAEDVEINREIILTVLEDTKLDIECAENGRLAVEMFSANPGKYDIIFMDVHMPEVDGLEATRRIRALDLPEGARIPIVAMTANVFQEDIDKCLDAGMNDHIGKPISFEALFQMLQKYLG